TLQYSCLSHDCVNIGNSNIATYQDKIGLVPLLCRTNPPSSLSFDEQLQLNNNWNEIISGYTPRDLTQPTDQLITLGGVAEEFHQFWNNSQYLAGLWRHNLLKDLLWSIKTTESP
ncbi:hypothetical protein V5O48_018985, partial [Marasmius crinis-equi]